MEKILKRLNEFIPNDKLLHAYYGDVLYTISLIVLTLVSFFITMSMATIFILATVIVVLVATSKEVYDYFNKSKHTPDILDIIYTSKNAVMITLTVLFLLFRG